MIAVQRRPTARRDLIEMAAYLGQSNPALSDQFLDIAERTCELLATMPGVGAPFLLANLRFHGLRYHPMQTFPKHLVFYLPLGRGIEVVRVLHGARDLQSILEDGH